MPKSSASSEKALREFVCWCLISQKVWSEFVIDASFGQKVLSESCYWCLISQKVPGEYVIDAFLKTTSKWIWYWFLISQKGPSDFVIDASPVKKY